jgi:hypothetical protein
MVSGIDALVLFVISDRGAHEAGDVRAAPIADHLANGISENEHAGPL